MKKIYTFIALSTLLILIAAKPYFNTKNVQLGYERVRTAYQQKEDLLKAELLGKGITNTNFELYFRAFKNEGTLEAWIKPKGATEYQLFKSYEICAVSGELGPKRQGGDYQTPEGFYNINRFNPQSNFFLSLGIDYPNASDRILSGASNLGGDIFIHGSCKTAGCFPMTDDKIKEIYVLAVEATHHGQVQIPVHIFPYRINEKLYNDAIFTSPRQLNEEEAKLIRFWRNLGEGMRYFDEHKNLPSVKVEATGLYSFN